MILKVWAYILRYVANTADRNVIKEDAETILKYEDLTLEVEHMWNLKTKVIPLI